MKVILLELTEVEAGYIKEALIESLALALSAPLRESEKERTLNRYTALSGKIVQALEPPKDDIITNNDLHHIISMAKSEYLTLPPDLHISNKPVEQNDFKHVALVNAAIMCFNGKGMMKKVAKFDYTDKSNQYEENE